MPVKFKLRGNAIKVLNKLRANLHGLAKVEQKQISAHLFVLGDKIAKNMERVLRPTIYSGELIDSVAVFVEGQTAEIGPTAKRGKWDAGLIHESGTGPIPRLPWGPIRDYAEVRGIQKPGAVWYKIKTEGVDPHPFVEKTFNLSKRSIQAVAKRLGEVVAKAILEI